MKSFDGDELDEMVKYCIEEEDKQKLIQNHDNMTTISEIKPEKPEYKKFSVSKSLGQLPVELS